MKSGAQIITTGSYQLSIQLLEEELDLEKAEAKDYIKKSVKLAKEALVESKCGKKKKKQFVFIANAKSVI